MNIHSYSYIPRIYISIEWISSLKWNKNKLYNPYCTVYVLAFNNCQINTYMGIATMQLSFMDVALTEQDLRWYG